jgi:hypothetical protein
VTEKWDTDYCFLEAARLLYPADVDLAKSYRPARGRAAARERMQQRFEGWSMLVSLAAIADTADRARQQLAAQGARRSA